jgi:dienelactone hydrolase
VADYVDATGEHTYENGICTGCGFSKKPYKRLTYFTVDVADENGKTYTDNAVLYLPANYSPDGEPVKLVIYCKQGSSQITSSSNPIESVGFYNYLISLGYAVLGVDGVPDAWRDELGLDNTRVVGNPVAVQGTEKAYNYVVENYNIASDGCFISGYSQGGHYAQNVIDLTDIPILAAAEQSPVCSMRYHQWDLTASQTIGGVKFTKAARLNVARIYGFPTIESNADLLDLAYDASLVAAYDPWVRNSQNVYTGFVQKSNLWYLPDGTTPDDITMTHTVKCPIKIWCAEDDTAISADVMKVFVKAIQNAGGTAEISVAESGGHGFFQKQTAVGTFTENGKKYNTLPIAVEIAQWFEQYGGYACPHSYSDNVCTMCGVHSWDTDGDGALEILAIGNSFSVGALEYFWQIADNLGIEEIVIGNLYIGGCSLETHAKNAKGDLGKYTYYHNDSGKWTSKSSTKISTALEERDWDFITLQQWSATSGVESSYNEDLTYLIDYVKERSNAKLGWHMTWAYQQNSTHSSFPTYGSDQMTMYNAIVSTVKTRS